MIDKIRLQNFKAHQDTTVPLGRLTMLVGDNGCGKTSVLEALSLLTMLGPLPHMTLQGDRAPKDLLRRGMDNVLTLTAVGGSGPLSKEVVFVLDSDGTAPETWRATVFVKGGGTKGPSSHRFSIDAYRRSVPISVDPPWNELRDAYKPAPLYSLDAKAIAAGAFGAGQEDQALDERGANTTAVLANMKLERDEDFEKVEAALRRIVPSLRRIRLQPVRDAKGSGHKIYFDFEGAAGVPAHGASHGTLITLALLAVLYGPNRPDLLLLDDFDHSLHPRAQIEFIKMLKELLALEDFAKLQIAATTHSPYVLDALSFEDVRAFALREDGTVASKGLEEHPDANSSRGMVSPGQLWSMDAERDWVIGG